MFVANIYSDPCLDILLDPSLWPTIDDLATAFKTFGKRTPTTPAEVTLDGFVGKRMALLYRPRPTSATASQGASWRGGIKAMVMGGYKDLAHPRRHGSLMMKGNGC